MNQVTRTMLSAGLHMLERTFSTLEERLLLWALALLGLWQAGELLWWMAGVLIGWAFP